LHPGVAVPADAAPACREVVLRRGRGPVADIAADGPRIVTFGLTLGDASDVDPRTGFPYRYLAAASRGRPLDAAAYNAAILRARAEGRIKTGSFLDRFATEASASAWLRERGRVLGQRGTAVEIPGGRRGSCASRGSRVASWSCEADTACCSTSSGRR